MAIFKVKVRKVQISESEILVEAKDEAEAMKYLEKNQAWHDDGSLDDEIPGTYSNTLVPISLTEITSKTEIPANFGSGNAAWNGVKSVESVLDAGTHVPNPPIKAVRLFLDMTYSVYGGKEEGFEKYKAAYLALKEAMSDSVRLDMVCIGRKSSRLINPRRNDVTLMRQYFGGESDPYPWKFLLTSPTALNVIFSDFEMSEAQHDTFSSAVQRVKAAGAETIIIEAAGGQKVFMDDSVCVSLNALSVRLPELVKEALRARNW